MNSPYHSHPLCTDLPSPSSPLTPLLNCSPRFFGLAVLLFTLICARNAAAQGALTNGWMHTGTISPIGDSDSWTFSANAGDTIVLRVGEITQSGNFTPRIRLQNPSAVQIALAQGAVAAEISVKATNTGTFTVIVDDAVGTSATGTYRLTLAKSPGTVFVAPGDEGGPMTNGVMHTGTIDPGDLDVWTFNANSGDAIIVRMGEIVDSSGNFTPWVRLYGPDGQLLDSGLAATAGEVAVRATNSGNFTVVVGDGNGTISGSGTYRLTLAKTGDPVVVSAGDEGGPMTNGVMHTGTVLTGDLDLWTFTANSGDNLLVRMGEITGTNTFTPWVRLFSPSGVLLSSSLFASAAEVSTRATNSGTFLVVVGDGNGTISGSGDYRLTLAKTGDPVVVSAGDDGGPMINGVMYTGTVLTGDLDVWTFTANSGDSLVVRMGEITDTNTFTPWIRLFSPSGVLLSSSLFASAAEVSTRATNSGTFLVVVGDGNGTISGSGDYRLTLAKTGDPVLVSAGDDGGPMTNGVTHTGTILTGDLDLWTFNANNGDNLIVRMGEITDTNTFTPWVRLFSPSGVLLGSSLNAAAAEVSARATNSGMFLVVVGDGNVNLSGSGDYRLTLAKTGASIEVAPGDEGGSLHFGVNPEGVITEGDLDVYSFTTCRGENISLQLDELIDNGNFSPWLRVYGPDGSLLGSAVGTTTAQVNLTATNSGTFIAVIGDGNNALNGTGTYRLTGNGLSDQLRLCNPVISGVNVNLAGIGGVSNQTFILYTWTNVTTPLSLWSPIVTNQFDGLGIFSYPYPYNQAEPRRYFRLALP